MHIPSVLITYMANSAKCDIANSNGQINQNLGYSGSETNQPPLTEIPE